MKRRTIAAILVLVLLGLLLPPTVLAKSRSHQPKPLVVVLDPGHGGSDSGAADSSETMVEKKMSLKIANRAAGYLRSKGYKVYLTRTRDQNVNTPPRDVNHDGHIKHVDELVARNVVANRHHADVFVSIHLDSSNSPSLHGTHGYYCPSRPFWRKNRKLAGLLSASVAAAITHAGYRDPNNGIATDVSDPIPQTRADYPWFLVLGPSMKHFVIATTMPGALIETLFLSSPRDVAALRHTSIVAAAGRGYANGIEAFFGGKVSH